MVTIVVTPPAAAARLADSRVSRCSPPGSPTKTRCIDKTGRIAASAAVDDLGALGRALVNRIGPRSNNVPVGDQHRSASIEIA
jgi:hypothetical protein